MAAFRLYAFRPQAKAVAVRAEQRGQVRLHGLPEKVAVRNCVPAVEKARVLHFSAARGFYALLEIYSIGST